MQEMGKDGPRAAALNYQMPSEIYHDWYSHDYPQEPQESENSLRSSHRLDNTLGSSHEVTGHPGYN